MAPESALLRKPFPWVAILIATLAIWLGFPNDLGSLPLLVLAWPAALAVIAASSASWGQAFYRGFAASFPGMFLALYWLNFPVRDVGGLPWPGAYACAMLIAACLATQGAFFCALLRFFLRLGIGPATLAAACIWYLLEFAYAVFPGFPWLPVAGALAQQPGLVQIADILGAYLAGAAWAALAIMGALALQLPCHRLRMLAIALAGMLLFSGYGFFRLHQTPFNPAPEGAATLDAMFVEGNVEQNQKWNPQFQQQTLSLYIDLSRRGLESAGIGMRPLVLWPETALPFFYEREPILRQETRAFVTGAQVPLLFGAPGVSFRPGLGGEAIYNRAFLLAPDGRTVGIYDKEHLVPFGEYVPRWLQLEFLSGLLQGVGVYEGGQSVAPLEYDSLALGVLICYEAIFPWLAQARVEAGANILVDISNDGWFRTSAAPWQHLYLGLLRCIEQNRWLLRSTNTGISAVADTRGRITMHGPGFTAGFLLARAQLVEEHSVFYRIGKFLPWLAFAILLILAFCSWTRAVKARLTTDQPVARRA